jgi:hypothetical protein
VSHKTIIIDGKMGAWLGEMEMSGVFFLFFCGIFILQARGDGGTIYTDIVGLYHP